MTRVLERDIETDFIERLQHEAKYRYRPEITDKAALEANFKTKFEKLNQVQLSPAEFARLRDEMVTPDSFEAATRLRAQHSFVRDDDTVLYFYLVNLQDWCKNEFEVISQLRMATRDSSHRYDVHLLLNGLPLVHVELKNIDVPTRKAMQQIVDYTKDSGNGLTNTLMCFTQLFVISSEHTTHYFANNRAEHFQFDSQEQFLPIYQHATANNQKITHLADFTKTFLDKCTLGRLIGRYMVLVKSERKVMVMRPYQIYAVEAIMARVKNQVGNGYIWHTTGSGKTLTSFKAATLMRDNPDLHKCLFVVDRKDLDTQTQKEFNLFQEGCVASNTTTQALVKRMLSNDRADKVIVTTIQKLGKALSESGQEGQRGASLRSQLLPLKNKRMAFVFDECHRSQFGDNHQAIKAFFEKAQMFGFTGTPIFEDNSQAVQREGTQASLKTTNDLFEACLHQYTITEAIEDRNVLKFHIEFMRPEDLASKSQTQVSQAKLVASILDKHDRLTNQRRFNAMFATQSIDEAIAYYDLFASEQAERQAHDPDYKPLNVTCVFSPPASLVQADALDLQDDLENERADYQDSSAATAKGEALARIIADYNQQFGTNHKATQFASFYEAVQNKIKAHKHSFKALPSSARLDLVIVVDMMLTGFDSKYLNTLYVNKNLKYHGMIQAFSRVNRTLNKSKPQGNIVSMLSKTNVDEAKTPKARFNQAIALFSGQDNQNAEAASKIWLVETPSEKMAEYQTAVEALTQFMDDQGLPCEPTAVHQLKGEHNRRTLMNKLRQVQKINNQLSQYTELDQSQMQAIMPARTLQGFRGVYLNMVQDYKAAEAKGEGDASPDLPQIELDLVLFDQVQVDYDYIMKLLEQAGSHSGSTKKASRAEIIELMASSTSMMHEKAGLTEFVQQLELNREFDQAQLDREYQAFKKQKKQAVVQVMASKHGCNAMQLQALIKQTLKVNRIDADALDELLVPLNLGWKAKFQATQALLQDLRPYLQQESGGRAIVGLDDYQ